MKFQAPLIQGTLLKRYKRFLADIELEDGSKIVAHVANSGSMLGVSEPGSLCRLSLSPNLDRKLRHSLEMVRVSTGAWVGVNTSLTNKLVHEAFENKIVKGWTRFSEIQREVKINKESRLDFLLTGRSKKRYVEVKNVSMARPPLAVFPDAVTERGQKHLKDLARLARQGFEAEIFFVVQREDCEVFHPCDDIDPVYGKLLRKVAKEGVKLQCWSCTLAPGSIELSHPIKIDLS
jgi:sugar fermentation stimulation protein A